jgi:hypothetical protein
MNVSSWLLWGFVATLMLTIVLAGSQGLHLTRLSIPYLLGTIFTPSRDHAKIVGVCVHIANGLLFSLLYVAAFEAWQRATWWLGATIGLVHASVVLTVGMQALPGLHPRMADEQRGPTVTKQLEPPGFLALNYGLRTPIFVLAAHVVFGAVLGAFYRL